MARHLRLLLLATLAASSSVTSAHGQARQFQCTGDVGGIPGRAVLEVTPGGTYTEGPGVAGSITTDSAAYLFSGTLFGGTEGYVSLVEQTTGERIDRVWIGVSQSGFALRTEDGATYAFQCQA